MLNVNFGFARKHQKLIICRMYILTITTQLCFSLYNYQCTICKLIEKLQFSCAKSNMCKKYAVIYLIPNQFGTTLRQVINNHHLGLTFLYFPLFRTLGFTYSLTKLLSTNLLQRFPLFQLSIFFKSDIAWNLPFNCLKATANYAQSATTYIWLLINYLKRKICRAVFGPTSENCCSSLTLPSFSRCRTCCLWFVLGLPLGFFGTFFCGTGLGLRTCQSGGLSGSSAALASFSVSLSLRLDGVALAVTLLQLGSESVDNLVLFRSNRVLGFGCGGVSGNLNILCFCDVFRTSTSSKF